MIRSVRKRSLKSKEADRWARPGCAWQADRAPRRRLPRRYTCTLTIMCRERARELHLVLCVLETEKPMQSKPIAHRRPLTGAVPLADAVPPARSLFTPSRTKSPSWPPAPYR